MNAMLITVGIIILVGLAILIGVSMDTEAQRAEWQEIARERREHRDELAALQLERERLREERHRLQEALGGLRNHSPAVCEHCPLRRFRP